MVITYKLTHNYGSRLAPHARMQRDILTHTHPSYPLKHKQTEMRSNWSTHKTLDDESMLLQIHIHSHTHTYIHSQWYEHGSMVMLNQEFTFLCSAVAGIAGASANTKCKCQNRSVQSKPGSKASKLVVGNKVINSQSIRLQWLAVHNGRMDGWTNGCEIKDKSKSSFSQNR